MVRRRFARVWLALALAGCGTPSPHPTTPKGKAPKNPVVQLALGRQHSCLVRADGTVSCWGSNKVGQLGQPTTERCSHAFLGAAPEFEPCSTSPRPVPGLANVTQIALGDEHTCARRSDGAVACWGSAASGAIGISTMTTCDVSTPCVTAPAWVPGLTNVSQVAAGKGHSCALTADGLVSCWGDNAHGQLGDGTTKKRAAPVRVPLLTGVIEISLGHSHSCALKMDGTVWCWGSGEHQALGHPATEGCQELPCSTTPGMVTGLSAVTQIDLGGDHSCARKSDGTLACWGFNGTGQLGDHTTTTRGAPTQVPDLTDIAQVAAGGDHTCARTTGGAVLCWGAHNDHEVIGGVGPPDRSTPVALPELATVVEIAHGEEHGCARRANGIVSCWGPNDLGQLGIGVASSWKKPTRLAGL